MQWYYAVGGQRLGPVSEAEYEKLVRDGAIKPETLVWHQGMTNWQPHAAVATPAMAAAASPAVGADETETCFVSGRVYPKREMIQYEGKWISAEHRDTFFQRQREGVSQPGQFTYGNFGRRFVAKVLDMLLLWVTGAMFNAPLALWLLGSSNFLRPQVNPAMPRGFFVYQALSMLISVVVGLSYGIFFIRRYSATPGKMALGLKLVRADGSPLSVGRIIGRYFSEWISAMILCIGYFMAGFDDERRALHDRICDTRVIKLK